jgi:hypothetical protein
MGLKRCQSNCAAKALVHCVFRYGPDGLMNLWLCGHHYNRLAHLDHSKLEDLRTPKLAYIQERETVDANA